MNILLTGSTGFLGTSVSRVLEKKGYTVLNLSRPQYDLLDISSLKRARRAFPAVDYMVHLAAVVPRKAVEDTGALFGANMRLTQNLLTVFGPHTKGMLHASTIEVYGRIPRTQKITERTPAHPTTWYGKSKLKSEQLVLKTGKSMGIPTAVLRFSPLYGPGDMISRAIPNFISRAIAGETIEVKNPQNKRDYLHKEDAARAIFLAITKLAHGIFCIGTGHAVTIGAAARIIRDRINPLLPIYTIPSKAKRHDLVYSIARARRALSFAPRYIFPDNIDEEILWLKMRTPQ